jgi:hypothetical protein
MNSHERERVMDLHARGYTPKEIAITMRCRPWEIQDIIDECPASSAADRGIRPETVKQATEAQQLVRPKARV